MAATFPQSEYAFQEIKEGKASVLFPDGNTVFYNPVQEFNRDLSILVIKQFISVLSEERKKFSKRSRPVANLNLQEDRNGNSATTNDPSEIDAKIDSSLDILSTERIKTAVNKEDEPDDSPVVNILEALSATGLRSIRYALEIQGIHKIIANDISEAAVENIKRNIQHNKVEKIIEASLCDAGLFMYQHKFPATKRFQVIDLDPYGSPASFLDGAVQAIDDGGLLCITCTDMAGLCGNHGEASFAKYGAMPLKSKNCHEMALRLVLGSLDSHAGRYKRYIVPLLSISVDFYIRVFVRVFTSAMEVKRSASKKSYVLQCLGCDSFHLQPVGKRIEEGNKRKYNPSTGPVVGESCKECNRKFLFGGPIWSEPIHDQTFVENLLQRLKDDADLYTTSLRLTGILSVVSEELMDVPLYYVIDKLANVIHCSTPSMLQFRSSLIRLGYNVSCSHANCNGIKTNAPNSVIWDILRCWERLHPINEKKRTGSSPAAAILSKEPKIEASFEILPEANPKSRKMKISRFPENPKPDWGPKARAKGNNGYQSLAEKRKQLQGKKMKRRKDSDICDTKKFLCKRYKEGTCKFDDEKCKYSHKETQEFASGKKIEHKHETVEVDSS